jgi:hypothetical protein
MSIMTPAAGYDPPGSGGFVPPSGQASSSSGTSAASTNATSVLAAPGFLYSLLASNQSGSTRFIKLYDLAAAPTVGTDVPVLTVPVAASACVVIALGSFGIAFANGIAYAITANVADSDTTAIGAGDIHLVMNHS